MKLRKVILLTQLGDAVEKKSPEDVCHHEVTLIARFLYSDKGLEVEPRPMM